MSGGTICFGNQAALRPGGALKLSIGQGAGAGSQTAIAKISSLARSRRMGVRLTTGPNVEMGLESGRRENRFEAPEYGIQLNGSVRC